MTTQRNPLKIGVKAASDIYHDIIRYDAIVTPLRHLVTQQELD